MKRAGEGWLGAPIPFDEDGKLVTGEGHQLANPAFSFGAQQGGKLGAVDELKRIQSQAPVHLPTRSYPSVRVEATYEPQPSSERSRRGVIGKFGGGQGRSQGCV